VGASIAANKIRAPRRACHDFFTARQSREDDDANVPAWVRVLASPPPSRSPASG
jgi:hypothetical protein